MRVKVTYGPPGPCAHGADAPPSPPRWGWTSVPHPHDATQHHLVPLLDIRYHRWDYPCPCGARPDIVAGDRLINHRAFDGRDAYEAGDRKMH